MPQKSPNNIARIDTHNTHGWQVRVTRQGTRHTKFFADGRHDDADHALAQAVVYRDDLIAQLPPPSSGTERAALARSTSGVPGVRLRLDRRLPYIDADTLTNEGKRKVRSFSLKRWGLRKALWEACRWKAEMKFGDASSDRVNQMYETAYATIRKQLDSYERESGVRIEA